MAIAAVATFEVLPGRIQEFQGTIQEARKHHERLGGSVRIWQATIAGEASNRTLYVIEHADMSAYAAFTDKVNADAEWLKFIQKVQSNPSANWVSSSLLTETPAA